ncbi:MAG TPA: choice-of-anchor D domain-containing protein [Usitatibacter sp.]|nr:choice-of-anchor D domain-containing protein [Usitatibacter sp.]
MTRVAMTAGPARRFHVRACLGFLLLLATLAFGARAQSVVTNTHDSGPGSLRAAILYVNSECGGQQISFSLVGGPHTIHPLTELPALTCQNAYIDGYAQEDLGASMNSDGGSGNDAVIQIVLDGSSCTGESPCSGITLSGQNSRVRGLAIHSFGGPGVTINTASYAWVTGNYIGTDPGGMSALPNGKGVYVAAGQGLIGDQSSPTSGRNLISGNDVAGVYVAGGATARIHGNQIGGNRDGSAGNANHGPGIWFGSACCQNVVFANHIRYNTGAGVQLDAGDSVEIRSNSIFGNGGPGIDLGADGDTSNDYGSPPGVMPDGDGGANGLANSPDVISVFHDAGMTSVNVEVTGAPAGKWVLIELFANGAMPATRSGETLIDYTSLQLDANGFASHTFTVPGTHDFISATASHDQCGDACYWTSEFSAAAAATPLPSPAQVTNTNDSGPGSLRAAIHYANAPCETAMREPDLLPKSRRKSAGTTITFAIPGDGPHMIMPISSLPTLYCGPILIDGYSQAGSARNVEAGGSNNADIRIALNGQNCTECDGIRLSGSGSGVQGLAIYGFTGGAAIRVIADSDVSIHGNYIGVDPGGMSAPAGNQYGVYVDDGTAIIGLQGNVGTRNLITNNAAAGVFVRGALPGLAPPGEEPKAARKGLKGFGFGVLSASMNQIGGKRNGEPGLGNGGAGVHFENAVSFFGVANTLVSNFIHSNGDVGVRVDQGQAVHLLANSIYGNAGAAMDLRANGLSVGPSPNDLDNSDGVLNKPVITSVTHVGGNVVIEAYVEPVNEGTTVRFDFFHNDAMPGQPEGAFYMGFTEETAAMTGRVNTTVTISGFPGNNVTATATYVACFAECPAQTSEYSEAVAASLAPMATLSFNPATIPLGNGSTLQAVVSNPNTGPITGVTFTISLPEGLTTSGPSFQSDCFAAGSEWSTGSTLTSASVLGMPMNGGGTCTVDIPVTAVAVGTYVYPANALAISSSAGPGTNASSASLMVDYTPPIVGFSASSTTTVGANTPVGVFVSRGTGGNYFGMDVSVTFPGGATISPVPNAGTSCSAAINAPTGAGSYSATGGSIIAPVSGCTLVTAQLVFPAPGIYELRIEPGAFTSSSPVAYSNSEAITHLITVNPPPSPSVFLSPSPLAFGSVPVGSSAAQNVTIVNTGSADLVVSSVGALGASFSTGTAACLLSPIPAGGNCAFPATFTPAAAGSHTGVVQVFSNASGSPHQVSANGIGTAAAVSLTPSPLNFGTVPVGGSASGNITVTNTGSATLIVSSATIAGAGFGMTHNCTAPIGPGATCLLFVTVSPTTTGPMSATVSIVSNASGSPHGTSVLATATAPGVSLAPTPLNFSNVPVGSSANGVVTLTNTGTAPLAISAIATSGAPFTQSNTCGTSLAAGASCPITVTFAPTAAGAQSGSLSVVSNAGTHTAPLSGVGATPGLQLSATSLDFALQTINTDSAARNVTVTNNGTAPLNVSAITVSGDYVFTGCPTPLTLAVGNNCVLSVKFHPTATGARAGSISIASNASGSPHVIALSGSGTPVPLPAIALTPGSHDFGTLLAGTSATVTFSLSNTGTANLDINNILLTDPSPIPAGALPGGYSQAHDCPVTLAPSAACSIVVTFTPPGPGGPYATDLRIVSNAAPNPFIAPLSGFSTSATAPGLQLSASSVNFNPQFVGTTSVAQTVTLTSNGTEDLVITSITSDGDFGYSGCGPGTMAPGEVCDFSITFRPLTEGPQSGSISVASNAPGSPHLVVLSGEGASLVSAAINLNPAAVAFGSVRTGLSATQAVTLANTGGAPLVVSQLQVTGSFFALAGHSCPASLAPGQSCVLTVSYTPTASGPHSGQLRIVSNAIPSPHIAALSGTGMVVPPPSLSVDSSLGFGEQVTGTTARRTLALRNTGGDPLRISAFTLTGADAAAFNVEGACAEIAPAASCELVVAFTPTALRDFVARLDIASNHAGGVVQVNLAGAGVALPQPNLRVSVGALGFGTLGQGRDSETRFVQLTSIGAVPIQIGAITGPPDYIVTHDCPALLASGLSCEVRVVFHPLSTGPRVGSVTIATNGVPASHTVNVTGVGCRLVVFGRAGTARLCSP